MPESDCSVEIDTPILPGLNGSGEGHWQWHWLQDTPNARRVDQESWICPDLASWRERLEETLSHGQDVWLVAHSLGCILAANLADSPLVARVKGALLVAPCDLAVVEELHPCIVNFGTMPEKHLPFPSLVVGSLDDPYMDFGTTQRLAHAWGSELVNLGHAGHINIRSGYGRWPQGYELLQRLQTSRDSDTKNTARALGIKRPAVQIAYTG